MLTFALAVVAADTGAAKSDAGAVPRDRRSVGFVRRKFLRVNFVAEACLQEVGRSLKHGKSRGRLEKLPNAYTHTPENTQNVLDNSRDHRPTTCYHVLQENIGVDQSQKTNPATKPSKQEHNNRGAIGLRKQQHRIATEEDGAARVLVTHLLRVAQARRELW